jgi:arylsulfatase A-like enzyme
VIVLMSDDQTAASQSVMKHTDALLGDRGTTFDNSFTNWPLCCPSRATFLMAQYAHDHGVLAPAAVRWLRAARPLAHAAGLAAAIRLLHGRDRQGLNGYEQSPVGVPPGWSEWHGTKRTYFYYGEELLENGQVHTYGTARENPYNPAHPETYSTDLFTGAR